MCTYNVLIAYCIKKPVRKYSLWFLCLIIVPSDDATIAQLLLGIYMSRLGYFVGELRVNSHVNFLSNLSRIVYLYL